MTITFDGSYGMPSSVRHPAAARHGYPLTCDGLKGKAVTGETVMGFPTRHWYPLTCDGPRHYKPSQMDCSWMYHVHRSSTEYREGVTEFVTFAENDRKSRMSMYILCPCRDYKNEKMNLDSSEAHSHLITNGFMKKYTCWTKHGEQEAPDAATEEVLDQDVENTAAAREGMFVSSPLGGETIDLDTQCLSTMLHDIGDTEDNDRDFEKFSRGGRGYYGFNPFGVPPVTASIYRRPSPVTAFIWRLAETNTSDGLLVTCPSKVGVISDGQPPVKGDWTHQ
uniref:Polyprotein n=1 Tax=Oryza sativa subsp. japonica TaxID=39947 RepID=Q5KQE4_ORYSJ|nr:putative polyprotein [Oryza sativa Japonica Group]